MRGSQQKMFRNLNFPQKSFFLVFSFLSQFIFAEQAENLNIMKVIQP